MGDNIQQVHRNNNPGYAHRRARQAALQAAKLRGPGAFAWEKLRAGKFLKFGAAELALEVPLAMIAHGKQQQEEIERKREHQHNVPDMSEQMLQMNISRERYRLKQQDARVKRTLNMTKGLHSL